ncbi:hypothetical protein ABRP58_11975 [Pectobacterium aroidearum]|uniref:hypothetical protein n=1 Tax=Pectobacterium aroidearum TaxID=1201031 RepID=UPI0015F71A7E|nr:hypothetical protein [Pectobacterium aroidearum]MBA5600610.1 hypothetical protein [Pectobacterium aroidearum]UUE37508.1 hypothetical protein L0Y26_06215 [Pectobacterium aroidearum]UUE41885.1 hypothetical protein L0Y25_06215 [Pectobacterium aroidearum]
MNDGIDPIGSHKKFPGEMFNVASATARRVAAKDGRHKKRQHTGWRLGSVPTVMSEKMPNYA